MGLLVAGLLLLAGSGRASAPAVTKDHSPQGVRLRACANGAMPVHVRLEGARITEDPSAPLFAIVPLRVRHPAWAAVVLLVSGTLDGDELDAAAELGRLAVARADEAHASVRLRYTAEHDALTGTVNRRSLDQWLAREFAAGAAPLAVLFIDIDLFKAGQRYPWTRLRR